MEAFVADHPQHADRLRRILPTMLVLANLSSDGDPLRILDVTGDQSAAGESRTLGDYRLIREVGRGGMGIVYEAEQISLSRRVALKILPFASVLDPRHLQRFKNEALAAAHLDHPNIVEVYGVGCERGIHFYAMRFVDGVTLADVIAQCSPVAPRQETSPQCSPVASPGLPGSQVLEASLPAVSLSNRPTPRQETSGVRVGQAMPDDSFVLPNADSRQPPDEPTSPSLPVSLSPGLSPSAPASLNPEPRTLNPSLADTALVAAAPTLAVTPLDPRSSLLDPSSRDFFRTVAELGIQAAEALEHAHQTGIVHRDIKPSNLMIEATRARVGWAESREAHADSPLPTRERPGEGQSAIPHSPFPIPHSPTLYITDFGLARVESDATLTMTGDLLGTLRYMSPEQAEGKSAILDHRTDIYSLGVTLYELLTGRPAFTATDRATLLKQLAHDDPTPPRKLNPAIPADLETIILKSAAKDSADRYQSARQLADDLRRFLDQKPIAAKPPSIWQRTTKWSRRHSRLTTAALVTLVLLVTAISGVAVLLVRAHETESALRETAEEKGELASANLIKAIDAIDRMLLQVASERLRDVPEVDETQRAIIGDAVELLKSLRDTNLDNPKLLERLAATHHLVGSYHSESDMQEQAAESFNTSVTLYEDLLKAFPDSKRYIRSLAYAKRYRSVALGRLFQFDEAAREMREAESLFNVNHADPNDPEDMSFVLSTYQDRSAEHTNQGKISEAAKILREAEQLLASLPPNSRNHPRVRFVAIKLAQSLAIVAADPDRNERYWRQAADLSREATNNNELIYSLLNLQNNLRTRGRYEESLQLIGEAQKHIDGMTLRSPARADLLALLASSHRDASRVYAAMSDHARAEAALRESIELWNELARRLSIPRIRCFLTEATFKELAHVLATDGRAMAGIEVHVQHMELWDRLWAKFPKRTWYFHSYCNAVESFADAVTHESIRSAADVEQESWDRATLKIQSYIQDHDDDVRARRALANLCLRKAFYFAQRNDRIFEAQMAREKATEICDELANERLKTDDPALINILYPLGLLQYRAGQFHASLQNFEIVVKSHRDGELTAAFNKPEGTAWDHFYVSMNHAQLGNAKEAKVWFDKGVGWMEKWVPSNDSSSKAEIPAQNWMEMNVPGYTDLHALQKEAAALIDTIAARTAN